MFKRTSLYISLTAAGLILVGCGGGGGGSSPNQTAQSVTPSTPVANTVATPDPGVLRKAMGVGARATESTTSTITTLRVYQSTLGLAPAGSQLADHVALTVNSGSGGLAARLMTNPSVASLSDIELSKKVLANMSITTATVAVASYNALVDAVAQQFGTYGMSARGQIIANLSDILPGLTTDPTWGKAATAFNAQIALNTEYSGDKANTVDLTPVMSLKPTLYKTSYENAKFAQTFKLNIPRSEQGTYSDGPLAWAMGDFMKTGKIMFFGAVQRYKHDDSYSASLPVSDFNFYTVSADGKINLSKSFKGCLHPRKALTADFNQDGTPDIFVLCTGYDGAPWPGENSKLILSNGSGDFTVKDIFIGYSHGAAAADINGDGYPDIVTTNSGQAYNNLVRSGVQTAPIHALINNRNGTFTKDATRIMTLDSSQQYHTTIELIDVNSDGIHDLLVGGGNDTVGHPTTKILYGDSNGKFGVKHALIPTVAGRGTVLDFAVVGRNLYVGRTGDHTQPGIHYTTHTLQRVNLDTLQSAVILDAPGPRGPGQWVAWWSVVNHNGVQGVTAWKNDYTVSGVVYQ